MKTCLAPIACAAIRQPSMNRCGTRRISSRSLNAPGSDSSALATTYVGLPATSGGWTRLSLRPIGKPAPPRPRNVAVEISSITASRVIPRAFVSAPYPPAARYSASCVRSRSSAPARTSSLAIELLHDPRHVLGLRRLAVAVIHDDDRRVAATAGALDRPQRDLAVLARLARRHAELSLERVDDPLRADERTRDTGADLDQVLAHRREVVHVVEGGDGLHVRRSEVERLGDLAQRVGRKPAVVLLREPQSVHDARLAVGIRLSGGPDLVGEAQRSTSPITVSSEPTIAIRSA